MGENVSITKEKSIQKEDIPLVSPLKATDDVSVACSPDETTKLNKSNSAEFKSDGSSGPSKSLHKEITLVAFAEESIPSSKENLLSEEKKEKSAEEAKDRKSLSCKML